MPKADSPTSISDRPRRNVNLPMRYRQPPAFSATALPAHYVPRRAAVCHRNHTQVATASTSMCTNNAYRAEHDGRVERKHQQQLQGKDAEIKELMGRIRRLEQSERRLKTKLLRSDEEGATRGAELGEIRRALHVAEEGLQEKEETMRGLVREVHHYQGWWLNEYYCLKVALKLATRNHRNDEGLKAMKESSQARFMKWSGSHQP